MSKREREQQRFQRAIADIDPLFERAREWADLSNCLQKINVVIGMNEEMTIPNKQDLAKRLAQCLNPDLNMIHQRTLDVYQTIFAREIEIMEASERKTWGEDLGLFYSGLFNFYQFAAFNVKTKFLEIVEKQILKLKMELVISLPGFMICMMHALDDQNAELTKKVEHILLQTEVIVGTSRFFGEMWKTMLRTPKCCLQAIKYLAKRIPKTPMLAAANWENIHLSDAHLTIKEGLIQLENQGTEELSLTEANYLMMLQVPQPEQDHDQDEYELSLVPPYFYFYYPNKQPLVNNALLFGLESDKSQLVNRATLDFLISHMPINGIEGSKVVLNMKEEKIRLMEGALITLVIQDFACIKKFFTWFLEDNDEYDEELDFEDDEAIKTVIPALQRIFQRFKRLEQDSVAKQIGIGKSSGMDMVGNQGKSQLIITPLRILNKLLDNAENSSIQKTIISQISVDLISYIVHFYQNEKPEPEKFKKFQDEAKILFDTIRTQIGQVWEALGRQLQEEINDVQDRGGRIVTIDLIKFCLREEELLIDQKDKTFGEEEMDECLEIVSILLRGVYRLKNSMPALELIEELLLFFDNINVPQSKLGKSVDHFNEFYSLKITANSEAINEQEDVTIFTKCSDILVKIQKYSDYIDPTQKPQWLMNVIRDSCNSNLNAKVLLVSIQTVKKILEEARNYHKKRIPKLDQAQMREELPPIDAKGKRGQIQVLHTRSMAQPTTQKLNYRKDTRKEANVIYCLEDMIRDSNDENAQCMCIIKTLWSMLDKQQYHDKIVALAMSFDELLPEEFATVVTEELISMPDREKTREELQSAVKKFAIFWKLTESHKEYTAFLPIYERVSGMVHDVMKDRRSYTALHEMLMILQNSDPTLRLECRSWLSESKNSFYRILDPLLAEFMANTKVYTSMSGQLFFVNEYNTKHVIDNFNKLRNIIMNLNTQDQFLNYIMTKFQTDPTKTKFDKQTLAGNFSPKNQQFPVKHCSNRYIQVITCITLQFIMAQAAESINEELYRQTQTVNQSACEFMELILKSMQKFPSLATEMTHLVIEPLVSTLSCAIENKNNALQVHLLNLLKVLFEGEFFFKPEMKNDKATEQLAVHAQKIFEEDKFMGCIKEGMCNKVSFVRYAFISFAEEMVKKMHEAIGDKKKKVSQHITDLTLCFTELLGFVDVMPITGDETQKRVPTKITAAVTAFDGNKINQEMDVIQLVTGLTKILHYCLNITGDLDEEIQRQEEELQELKGQEEEQTSLIGRFFGFGGKKLNVREEDSNVSTRIFEILHKILVACLNCWSSKPILQLRNFYFTRSGMFAYHQDDNEPAQDLIDQFRVYQLKQPPSQLGKAPQVEVQFRDWLLKENLNPIQKAVIDLIDPIACKSVDGFVEGILDIWVNQTLLTYHMSQAKEACQNLVQIVLYTQLQPHQIVSATEAYVKKMEKKHPELILSQRKKTYTLTNRDKKEATFQSLLCQFVYTILLQSPKVPMDSKNVGQQVPPEVQFASTVDLYRNITKFFKAFMGSKHPNTICWLLEILYLLSDKFKAENSVLDKKLKGDLGLILDSLLKALANILQDQFGLKYQSDYGITSLTFSPTVYEMLKRFQFVQDRCMFTNSELKDYTKYAEKLTNRDFHFTKEELSERQELQMPPDNTMFQRMDIVRNGTLQQDSNKTGEELGLFMQQINLALHNAGGHKVQEEKQSLYFKFFVITSLRQLLVRLIQSVGGLDTRQKDASLALITNTIIKQIDQLIKNINNKKEFGTKQRILVEMFTQVIADLSRDAAQQIQIHFKKEIMDIFHSENFFQQSECTLVKWQVIIRQFTNLSNEGVLEGLLQQYNKIGGLFVASSAELKQKSLTFKRLAFVVFSSKIDQIQDSQQESLLKRMIDGFKNPKKDMDMKMQLFLLSRILMLRLPPQKLAEAMRKLWPHLLDELHHVFANSRGNKLTIDTLSLAFEGLKLVELMSQLNIEDFQMNQWMFLFDGYGMIKQPNEMRNPMSTRASNDPALINTNAASDFVNVDHPLFYTARGQNVVCQPYLVKFMCNMPEQSVEPGMIKDSEYSKETQVNFYTVAEQQLQEQKVTQFKQTDLRKTVINTSTKEVEEAVQKKGLEQGIKTKAMEVAAYATNLQQNLSEANVKRTQIDRVSAEALIQKDFLRKQSQQ